MIYVKSVLRREEEVEKANVIDQDVELEVEIAEGSTNLDATGVLANIVHGHYKLIRGTVMMT